MLAPTPLLKPSPMDISALFSSTFEVLKRRFGLFILLVLLPSIVAIVGMIGVGLVAVATLGTLSNRMATPPPSVLVLLIGLIILVVMVSTLAQYKSMAMMIQATYEIGQGYRPTLSSLFANTRGFLPRAFGLFLLVLLIAAAIAAIYSVAFVTLFAGPLASNSRDGFGPAIAMAIVFLLSALVFLFLSIWLGTKLLYTLQAMTLEQTGPIASLKRSWQLTSGSFWRTLGYYLVAMIAASAVSFVFSTIGQVLGMGSAAGLVQSDGTLNSAAAWAMIPMFIILVLLQIAAQLLVTPFLVSYQTCMYLDQHRRLEIGTQHPYPTAPAGWTPPAQNPAGQYPPGYYPPAQNPPAQYPSAQNPQAPYPPTQNPPDGYYPPQP